MSITNTYPQVLHLITKKYNGKVRAIERRCVRHRTIYRWEARGPTAVRFLRVVRPYLIEKQRQADIVIELDGLGVAYDSSYVKHLIMELAMLKRIDYAKETRSPD